MIFMIIRRNFTFKLLFILFFAIFPVCLGSCDSRWQFSNGLLYCFSLIKRHYCDTLSGALHLFGDLSSLKKMTQNKQYTCTCGLDYHQENELEIKEHNEFGSLEKKNSSQPTPPPHLNNKTEPHSICSEFVSLLPASPHLIPFWNYFFLLVFFSWLYLCTGMFLVMQQVCVSSVWPFVRLPRSATVRMCVPLADSGCEMSVNKHFYHDQSYSMVRKAKCEIQKVWVVLASISSYSCRYHTDTDTMLKSIFLISRSIHVPQIETIWEGEWKIANWLDKTRIIRKRAIKSEYKGLRSFTKATQNVVFQKTSLTQDTAHSCMTLLSMYISIQICLSSSKSKADHHLECSWGSCVIYAGIIRLYRS